MADDRNLFDEVLDVAVYAPIGAAVRLAQGLPGLVADGRTRVEGTVKVAGMVGRLAVGTARRRIEGVVSSGSSLFATSTRSSSPDLGSDSGEEAPRESPAPISPRSGAEELAIPGYDALAASQVVARLEGLSPRELEAVRRYEEANRRRRTILGRIAQLSGHTTNG